jgi:hypothetical protein
MKNRKQTVNTNQWNRDVVVMFKRHVDDLGVLPLEFFLGLAQQFKGNRTILILAQPITKSTPQRACPFGFGTKSTPLKTELFPVHRGIQNNYRETSES